MGAKSLREQRAGKVLSLVLMSFAKRAFSPWRAMLIKP
jgi:hypothetical protein